MLTGAVRTVPSGTRFALGTKLGTFSVEAKSSKFAISGKAAQFSDLRLGSSVTIVGTLVPSSGRATITAARIEIAPTPTPGTPRRRTASNKS